LHWSDNPLCNDAWYESEKTKYGHDPVMIAQELDIDAGASISNLMLPNDWIRPCIGKRYASDSDAVVAGFDMASSGSNKNAVVIRCGSNVKHVEVWSGSNDLPASVYRAVEVAKLWDVSVFTYDAVGMGETISGLLKRIDSLPFDTKAVKASSKPIERRMVNGRLSTDFFLNLKAQLWWNVRDRALRTYQYEVKNTDDAVNLDSLLSLPEHSDLITQLITPMMKYTSTGKVMVETKDDLKRRGVMSPDIADALILAFSTDVLSVEPHLEYNEYEKQDEITNKNYDAREEIESRANTLPRSEARNEIRQKYNVFAGRKI